MNPLFRVLAFSSSRAGGGAYLQNAAPAIRQLLGDAPLQIAFIPFAAIDDYEGYGRRVEEGLGAMPHTLHVAHPRNVVSLVENCDAVMIGGGNTFKLLHHLYEYKLLERIKTKVQGGTPYIGWSAGSNLTGPTIRTTNDMPILQPPSFDAFHFFPFQINPHYYIEVRENFHGETRDQRLEEFVRINRDTPVVCLPEGTWLQAEDGECRYQGELPGVIIAFENGHVTKRSLLPGEAVALP
jgi:dipeptidase E